MTKLCFDYDPLLFTAGSIGEKRFIKVVHRESGDEYEFSTRTDFWGHWKKKEGGWLAEYNNGRTSPRLPDEFDITDVQEPEPIEHCMRTLRQIIERVKDATDARSYYGYSGKGAPDRVELSTVMRYKGNRLGSVRPVHLNELKDYLVKRHACKIVTGIEADDAVSMDSYEAYAKWKKSKNDSDLLIMAAVDKDYLQCAAHILHPLDLKEIDTHDGGFGYLKEVDGEIKGRGRMWLYWQVLTGDSADHYKANAASDKRWGDKTARPYLLGAKNDKEALEGLVKAYKYLYPQPKEIIGWRGYEDQDKLTILKPDAERYKITVDWKSMLQENFTLAYMLKSRDDKFDLDRVLTKVGVAF